MAINVGRYVGDEVVLGWLLVARGDGLLMARKAPVPGQPAVEARDDHRVMPIPARGRSVERNEELAVGQLGDLRAGDRRRFRAAIRRTDGSLPEQCLHLRRVLEENRSLKLVTWHGHDVVDRVRLSWLDEAR